MFEKNAITFEPECTMNCPNVGFSKTNVHALACHGIYLTSPRNTISKVKAVMHRKVKFYDYFYINIFFYIYRSHTFGLVADHTDADSALTSIPLPVATAKVR